MRGAERGESFSFLFSSIRFCWNNLRNMIQFELSFCTGIIFFLEFFFFGGILLFHVVKSLIFLFCFVVFIKSCRNFTSKGYQFFSQFIYYYDYHINYLLTFKRDRLKQFFGQNQLPWNVFCTKSQKLQSFVCTLPPVNVDFFYNHLKLYHDGINVDCCFSCFFYQDFNLVIQLQGYLFWITHSTR